MVSVHSGPFGRSVVHFKDLGFYRRKLIMFLTIRFNCKLSKIIPIFPVKLCVDDKEYQTLEVDRNMKNRAILSSLNWSSVKHPFVILD